MKYSNDVKELVKERISIMPNNFKLSIGSYGTFSREELLQSIQKEDKVGLEVIRMQLDFIKALTSGMFTDAMNNE